MKGLAIAGLCLVAAPAYADGDPGARFAVEPSVRQLQRAAARVAEVNPERVRSWQRRVRLAALAPHLMVRVGRGGTELYSATALDGTPRVTIHDGDQWRFDAAATWSLDRLVFDREEMRLARESQRIAARREQLLTEVAQLYFDRRRLQLTVAADPAEQAEVGLEIDELTAVLDGLTDGALSHPNGAR